MKNKVLENKTTLHFFGGAGTVTGSNFMLETGATKILIDCGLTQGRHTAEAENWEKFPYEASSIHTLVVTHSHIDHIGRIPKLVKDGFKGKILSTDATKTLALPMLKDSMELLLHDAQKHGREPLYGEKEIEEAMQLWETKEYDTKVELPEGFTLTFRNSGHILGSAMAVFERGGKLLVFTGDLGGGNSPFLLPVYELADANYLVVESVYGNRVREKEDDRLGSLEDIIEDTAKRGGTLLIPAFSTERTQDLLFEIRLLMSEGRVPNMPVYADSPLAQKITESYLDYPQYFTPEIRERAEKGENIFSFPELHYVESAEESHVVSKKDGPKIIIAGSGMSNGGRVQAHEKVTLPNKNSTLLVVGYQAAGSLGRRLIDGDKHVRIAGEEVSVSCKVEALYGYSAHMDGEQLLEFVNKTASTLKEAFVVMGEPAAASFLAQRIRDYLGVKATTPEAGEQATIDF
jgi:metallo-beta-lactamase family protein